MRYTLERTNKPKAILLCPCYIYLFIFEQLKLIYFNSMFEFDLKFSHYLLPLLMVRCFWFLGEVLGGDRIVNTPYEVSRHIFSHF